MRRNRGLIGIRSDVTTSDATGIFDTFDVYNARVDSKWPSLPMDEIDWNLNITYNQPGTSSNFNYSWYPTSTGPSETISYKTTSIQATGTGSQTINASGNGQNTWYGVQESSDNTNWSTIASTDENTSSTLTFSYTRDKYYRFMVNYLGGQSTGSQVTRYHYIRTSPTNYLIVGGSSTHLDLNG